MKLKRLAQLILILSLTGLGGCRDKSPSTGRPGHRRTSEPTPLYSAVEKKDLEQVRTLLAEGVDVNAEGFGDETALHEAAFVGHLEIARLLIAHGADIESKIQDGTTPLHMAASWGHPEILGLLIEQGVNLQAVDNSNNTALHSALLWGKPNAAELLIAEGADVTARDNAGRTPLHLAAREGLSGTVEHLLAKGTPIDAKTEDGLTALHHAASRGHLDTVGLLLDAGADIDLQCADGQTALHYAITRGSILVVELLVEKGASLETRNASDETPLHAAAAMGRTSIARLLIAKGADVKARTHNGRTPLHAAVRGNHAGLVYLLLSHGADVNAQLSSGTTPLHSAAIRGYIQLVELLISHGADVNARLSSGTTPLHSAAVRGHIQVVELLIAHGADINASTVAGYTPLHSAVRHGHNAVAAVLVAHGADTTVKNKHGETPLDYAHPADRQELVRILTQESADTLPEDSEAIARTAAEIETADDPNLEPKTDLERLVWDNTAFALDLYQQLRSSPGNLFFSPSSISTALAMTYAGARENTEKQMAETLHFTLDQANLHPAFAAWRQEMESIQQNGDVQLRTANALWPQKRHPFLPKYLALLERHYGVSITPVDYTTRKAQDTTRETINAWVEARTEGHIADLIQPADLKSLTRLVLTNAIYFRGCWEEPFDPEDSREAIFFCSPSQCVDVTLMTQTERFNYAEVDSLQILELPYRGGDLSMLILLPRTIEGLAELESRLSVQKLTAWRRVLAEDFVWVTLPKFRTTFTARLKSTLESMGMTDAFQWPGANFAGFDGDPNWFYIGQVVHKAYVNVDERGTEAAASTAVVATMGGAPPPPPEFRADHPFLFLIQEKKTGSTLFMGRVTDPTLSSR